MGSDMRKVDMVGVLGDMARVTSDVYDEFLASLPENHAIKMMMNGRDPRSGVFRGFNPVGLLKLKAGNPDYVAGYVRATGRSEHEIRAALQARIESEELFVESLLADRH